VKIYSLLTAALLLAGSGCTRPQPAEPELAKTATIKDIMDSMVDPSGEFLFESVAEISDEQGVRQKAPHTEEEWTDVRRRAVTLIEAPNLLVMPGRKVAQPNEKPERQEIELPPDRIQQLIDADRVGFVNHAKDLQNAATTALKAIDARDTKGLFDALSGLDKACENCHLQYWYPPNNKKS
jgi:cytochrome c556